MVYLEGERAYVTEPDRMPWLAALALLFALGTLAYGAAWYVFGRVEEPEEEVAVGRTDLRLPLRRPGFRAYLTARLFLGLAGMVEPFYAAYAVRVLGEEAELGLYLALQAALNIGVTLGVLPVTGVPLPLVSYGGSSLLVSGFAVGLLSRLARGAAERPRRKGVAR